MLLLSAQKGLKACALLCLLLISAGILLFSFQASTLYLLDKAAGLPAAFEQLFHLYAQKKYFFSFQFLILLLPMTFMTLPWLLSFTIYNSLWRNILSYSLGSLVSISMLLLYTAALSYCFVQIQKDSGRKFSSDIPFDGSHLPGITVHVDLEKITDKKQVRISPMQWPWQSFRIFLTLWENARNFSWFYYAFAGLYLLLTIFAGFIRWKSGGGYYEKISSAAMAAGSVCLCYIVLLFLGR